MAFKKGMSVSLSEHHDFLEAFFAAILILVLVVLILALLNGWKSRRLDTDSLVVRGFRAFLIIICTGIFFGLWR